MRPSIPAPAPYSDRLLDLVDIRMDLEVTKPGRVGQLPVANFFRQYLSRRGPQDINGHWLLVVYLLATELLVNREIDLVFDYAFSCSAKNQKGSWRPGVNQFSRSSTACWQRSISDVCSGSHPTNREVRSAFR